MLVLVHPEGPRLSRPHGAVCCWAVCNCENEKCFHQKGSVQHRCHLQDSTRADQMHHLQGRSQVLVRPRAVIQGALSMHAIMHIHVPRSPSACLSASCPTSFCPFPAPSACLHPLQLLAPAWSSTMGQIGPPPRRSRSNSRKRAGRCLYLCQRWGALALDQGVTGSGGHWIWIGDALA